MFLIMHKYDADNGVEVSIHEDIIGCVETEDEAKAFVEKFDEHLANNYIITGERGSQYMIPLDRDLITWEE